MASTRASLITALLLAALALHAVVEHADAELGYHHKGINKPSRRSLLATIDCGAECSRRCSKSSRPNLCKRDCGTCCARCNCVPSGTYGNYQQCPCYASLTTHGGRKKCP